MNIRRFYALLLPTLAMVLLLGACAQSDDITTPRSVDLDPIDFADVEEFSAEFRLTIDEGEIPVKYVIDSEQEPQLQLSDPDDPISALIRFGAVADLESDFLDQQLYITRIDMNFSRLILDGETRVLEPGNAIQLGVYPFSLEVPEGVRLGESNGFGDPKQGYTVDVRGSVNAQNRTITLEYFINLLEVIIKPEYEIRPQRIGFTITISYV